MLTSSSSSSSSFAESESERESVHEFDPEPERTFRELRRQQRLRQQQQQQQHQSPIMSDAGTGGRSSRGRGSRGRGSDHGRGGRGPQTHTATLDDEQWHMQRIINEGPIDMVNDRDRPMRDYVVLNPAHLQTGIARPRIHTGHFEFKPMMFQMLQTAGQFGGFPHEDPYSHLRQFLDVCSNFVIPGVFEDAFRLKLFPYSLKDKAKNWLNSLEPNSIHTWDELAEKFLGKYFPPNKNAKLRNDITSFKQREGESLFEAWERWKELLRMCPHHGIPVVIQMETFYNGLDQPTRLILDASSGGVILNMSFTDACKLIDDIATHSSHWPTERLTPGKKAAGVHEISEVTALSAQVASLTNMIKNMSTSNVVASNTNATASEAPTAAAIEQGPSGGIVCVYCEQGHSYGECPYNPESVNFVSHNRGNSPYSNTYNSNWRNHPNFGWRNNNALNTNNAAPAIPPGFPPQQQQRQQAQNNNSNLEALMKTFISDCKTTLQTHESSIKTLENQIGQIASALTQRQNGSLPSTTEPSSSKQNGKDVSTAHVNAISLRSGTAYPEPPMPDVGKVPKKEPEKEKEKEKGKSVEKEKNNFDVVVSAPDAIASSSATTPKTAHKVVPEYPPPPYPQSSSASSWIC